MARQSRPAPSRSGVRGEGAEGERVPTTAHGSEGFLHEGADEPQSWGAGIHRDDALHMVGAVRRLEAAVTEGFAASYAGRALCGLTDDTTRGTYTSCGDTQRASANS